MMIIGLMVLACVVSIAQAFIVNDKMYQQYSVNSYVID